MDLFNTCLKWLLSETLVLTKPSGLPLDQNSLILLILSGLVKSNMCVKNQYIVISMSGIPPLI